MADTQNPDPAQAAAEAAAKAQAQVQDQQTKQAAQAGDFVTQVAQKIAEADNILVALSKNPSVDEMAAAIGLTLFLDGLGKHATAIYSGATPNALKFLKPGDTFEDNTNSLRDFIIALNKEKADHLRYKLDGDYVKVYITPYKTTIDESDLEFSHGDYNVDLVVALNVPTANDLDAALTEHGRIMHDAGAVDITTGEPGKFGEVEWSDTAASSVSELVTQLVLKLQNAETKVTAEEATAFLTGIVAATERFSNEKTTSAAMAMASRLMELGADQQLVATNVAPEPAPEPAPMGEIKQEETAEEVPEETPDEAPVDATAGNDPTTLDVSHEAAEPVLNTKEKVIEPEAGFVPPEPVVETETPVVPETPVMPEVVPPEPPAPVEPVPEIATTPVPGVVGSLEVPAEVPPSKVLEGAGSAATTDFSTNTPAPEVGIVGGVGQTIEPGAEFKEEVEKPKDYGAMIDAALAEGVPAAPEKLEENHLPEMDYTAATTPAVPMTPAATNPAPTQIPVPPEPVEDIVLPPPPAPNIDPNQMMPTDASGAPVLPQVQEVQPQVQQPVEQPQAADPSAFKIPGM